MRNTLDFLAMAVTALAISWATVDLYGRATDPHSRQHRSRGNHTDTVRLTSAPKAEGEGPLIVFAPPASLFRSSALASPSFPATFMAGQSTQEEKHDVASTPPNRKRSVTRPFPPTKEVSPPQGRIKPRKDAGSNRPAVTVGGAWQPVEISVYSARYHGGRTATGERYDHYRGFTAATTNLGRGRWALPKGSTWQVEYQGKRVTVRVNDCGSHRPRRAKVWLDLSGAAWSKVAGSPSRHVGRMRRVK